VRYVWIAIIAVSATPLTYFAWLGNPLSFMLLGAEEWRNRLARLYPYRWWILFLILVCAFSVAVYTARYT
jgi:predicted outer membrane lipoprotein